MSLLREQMNNYWREGSRMGEPNMGDVGDSMGEDEPTTYHHEPSMYDDQHTMYHDKPNMVEEEPKMCRTYHYFGRVKRDVV